RMGDVAVSFAAVIAMGATPIQMGLLAAVRLVPKLVFSLIAGVWVDCLPRRPLILGAFLGRLALLATIPSLPSLPGPPAAPANGRMLLSATFGEAVALRRLCS